MYGDSLGARITQLWLNVYGKMAKATWASGEGIPGIHLNGRTIIYYFCLRNYSEISVYQIIYHAWIVNSNYILCYISQSKTSCCLPGPKQDFKKAYVQHDSFCHYLMAVHSCAHHVFFFHVEERTTSLETVLAICFRRSAMENYYTLFQMPRASLQCSRDSAHRSNIFRNFSSL